MRVCGHREDAEDTAQEVLVKAIPYLHQFENANALTAWLYTVARNRCWMSRRRSKFAPTQHLSLDELMPDADELQRLMTSGASPERSVLLAEQKQRLQQAILQVPPQYRLVLVLHDIEELSGEEIAKVLGITEGNVRVRLHRARLFVRRELAKTSAQQAPKSSAPARRSARCKRIFSNLSNYMDGLLDDSLCQELEGHLKGCEPCQAFLEDLKQTVTALRSLPPESPATQPAAEARQQALAKSQSAQS
jgi:RNA polymerase sigma-70 factor (ECF subfamily)